MANDLPGEGSRAADPGRRERESEILGRVRAGEPEAFEYFVRTYQRKVFRLVYTLVRNAAEADALTQDVFVKAWRAVADFKGEAAFETWLNRIAVNAVRDSVRRRKPVVSFADLAAAEEVDGTDLPRAAEPTDGTSPERDALSRQIRQADRGGPRGALAAAAGDLRHEALRGAVDRRDRGRDRPRRRDGQVAPVPGGAQAAPEAGGPAMSGRHLTDEEIVGRVFPVEEGPAPIPIHQAVCPECQQRVAKLREAFLLDRGAVTGVVESLPAEFWAAQRRAVLGRISELAAVEAEEKATPFPARFTRSILHRPALAFGSLAAALALVAGLTVLRGGTEAGPSAGVATVAADPGEWRGRAFRGRSRGRRAPPLGRQRPFQRGVATRHSSRR